MSSLLPPSASSAEQALEGSIERISDVPVLVRSMWNPATCPSAILPWLAWAFSVDQWDPTWTDDQKRASITAAVVVQRYKGTIGSVREAVASLGIDVQVLEWFAQTPIGDPYTFELTLTADQVGIPQPTLSKLLDIVDSTKNLRSYLQAVVLTVTSDATLYAAAASCTGNDITVTYSATSGGVLMSDGSVMSDGGQISNGVKA